jgi:hypothetical protein
MLADEGVEVEKIPPRTPRANDEVAFAHALPRCETREALVSNPEKRRAHA